MINLYETQFMLPVVESVKPRKSFLRDRYFKDGAIFKTSEVLVEYREGNKKIAPFISPRRGPVTVFRDGYKTARLSPAMIGEQRTLTIDDLEKKGFGEAVFSNFGPAERQAQYLANDLAEMTDHILGTEEEMASQCILKNGIVERIYNGEFGGSDYEEWEVTYYEGENNPAVYTPAANWSASSTTIIDDLYNMSMMLIEEGVPAVDFVCAPDVASILLKNADLRQLLDINNFNIGQINEQLLGTGAVLHGRLNVHGSMLNIFSYAEKYENDKGIMTPYIPSGYGFVSAPAAGEAIYAAVSQIEQGSPDVKTYAAKRVPKYISDEKTNVRTLQLVSRPLLKPMQKNPWISAKLL